MVTENTKVGEEERVEELNLSCTLPASPIIESSNHTFPERQKHLSPNTTIWPLSRDKSPCLLVLKISLQSCE